MKSTTINGACGTWHKSPARSQRPLSVAQLRNRLKIRNTAQFVPRYGLACVSFPSPQPSPRGRGSKPGAFFAIPSPSGRRIQGEGIRATTSATSWVLRQSPKSHFKRPPEDIDLLEKEDSDVVTSLRNLELTLVSRDQEVNLPHSGPDEEIA
jgi:hypothetical protein